MSTLLWYRQDLRVADHAALTAAAADGPVIPVYIHSPEEEGPWAPGGASRWWLHRSLERLDQDLGRLGSRLVLRRAADSLEELRQLARECGARRIVWSRRYEPKPIARDKVIKASLLADGLDARSYNSALLFEPWEVANQSGRPFLVFTPFWRRCLELPEPAAPLATPERLAAPPRWPASCALSDLELEPRIDWAAGLARAWRPGSEGAQAGLQRFLREAHRDYAAARDRPGVSGTSRLSPHLHFGEISPRQVWRELRLRLAADGGEDTWRQSKFLTELGWREFAYHLLYHFPDTPEKPLRANYERFPWNDDGKLLRAWQRGLTGYPIVDAGMRELWQTGWMHNRMRMVTGSFLVKDLLLPWTAGAAWFWDTLVDADLASNTLGWQWVAGCGADAAPYFRIFNPVTQATRYDAEGTYVRQWVPELARLPSQWLQQPWEAPAVVLRDAGIVLGTTYPQRLVDHAIAREQALAALARIR